MEEAERRTIVETLSELITQDETMFEHLRASLSEGDRRQRQEMTSGVCNLADHFIESKLCRT